MSRWLSRLRTLMKYVHVGILSLICPHRMRIINCTLTSTVISFLREMVRYHPRHQAANTVENLQVRELQSCDCFDNSISSLYIDRKELHLSLCSSSSSVLPPPFPPSFPPSFLPPSSLLPLSLLSPPLPSPPLPFLPSPLSLYRRYTADEYGNG